MPPKRVEDIIPPSRRKAAAESKSVPVTEEYEPRGSGGRSILTIVSILLVAIIGSAGVAIAFSGAKAVIHPQQRQVTIDGTINVSRQDAAALPFEIVRVEKVGTQTVAATGSETVSERASGTVTVFNEFSSSPQRWVENTRFESPNGLIFRVREPVTIPGMENGTPGTVDVTIYADEAGAQYNVGLVDFTIPGLTGSPQFESLYAKAKTPISGGFEGQRPVVSESQAASTRTSMQNALRGDLENTITEQVPSGHTLLTNGIAIVFEPLSSGEAEKEGQAVLREKGTAIAIVFDTDKLARRLAEQTIGSYDGGDVTIGDTNTLTITNLPPASELLTATDLSLTLEGTVDIVWKVSPEQVKTEIAGKTRDSAEAVLRNIPGIERAELILRPFWRSAFPQDTNKIQVSIVAS